MVALPTLVASQSRQRRRRRDRLTFAAFATAGSLFRLLGEPFLRLASRIVGIVLLAIAVDFVLDGLREVFQT